MWGFRDIRGWKIHACVCVLVEESEKGMREKR